MLELVAKSRFSVFTNFENLIFVTTSLFCDAVHKLKRCESGFSASWSILLCTAGLFSSFCRLLAAAWSSPAPSSRKVLTIRTAAIRKVRRSDTGME